MLLIEATLRRLSDSFTLAHARSDNSNPEKFPRNMKSILLCLSVLPLFCMSGSSAEVTRFTGLRKDSEKVRREAKTGVFVRYEVGGQVRELEIFITDKKKVSELTSLLRSQGFKNKGEEVTKELDRLQSRFMKAFNPLNPSTIVVMETP